MRGDPNTHTVEAVSNAITGEVLEGVTGWPVNWLMDAEHILPADDIFTARRPDVFEMIDTATGTIRWTLEDAQPIAQTAQGVLAASGSMLRLLDRRTGTSLWEYESPSSNTGFGSAAFGNDTVFVAPNIPRRLNLHVFTPSRTIGLGACGTVLGWLKH